MRFLREFVVGGVVAVALISGVAVPVDGSVDASEPLEDFAPVDVNWFGGLAIDRFDTAYVVDREGARILAITPDGEVSTFAGGNGSGSASNQFDFPYSVAVDQRGNVFVSDFQNDRVQRIAPDRSVTTVLGGHGEDPVIGVTLRRPTGIAVDYLGNLYVADQLDRVLRVNPYGEIVVVAGGNGEGSGLGQLDGVNALAVDPSGNLFICDCGNNRILRVDAVDGAVANVPTGGLLNDASFVTSDGRGSIYVSNFLPFRVVKIEANGTASIVVDGSPFWPHGNGVLWPAGLAFDSAGSLYFADEMSDSIRVLRNTTTPGPREITGPYARTAGIEGSIARLYMAILSRQPDLDGYDFWIEQSVDGERLYDIAYQFLAGSEYKRTRSSLTDAEFVDRLYLEVMGRSGETSGVDYWLEVLAAGADRATVILSFSESAEFKRHTATY